MTTDSTGRCALRKHPTSQIHAHIRTGTAAAATPLGRALLLLSRLPLVVRQPLPTPLLPTTPMALPGARQPPKVPLSQHVLQPATNRDTVQTDSHASSSPGGQAQSSQGPRGPCPCDLTASSPRSSTPAAAPCSPRTHCTCHFSLCICPFTQNAQTAPLTTQSLLRPTFPADRAASTCHQHRPPSPSVPSAHTIASYPAHLFSQRL